MISKFITGLNLGRRNWPAALAALTVFPLLAVGQTGSVGPTPVPQVPQTKPAQQAPATVNTPGTPGENKAPAGNAASGAGAPVDSNSYKVGPADVLNVRVWDEEKFTGPVTVQQDGKITLPLVGQLQAGGLTPVQIQDSIAKSLTKYVVKPLVTVNVLEVGSKRYYMDGQVNRAGEYALVVPTTILEAISKAGGLQEFANSKKIYVLRGDKRIPFNLKDVIRGKHMEQNIHLEPGDHVVVP
ncbi:MAG: polysaccharide biosynthesis/export family protein [Acidobacteriaceae bacterium]|nr:polysaccharide biosynthesis/export family protein [Acidobacteriaceae bacterium]